MSSKPRLLLIGNQWSHMGGHSGLLPLAQALKPYFEVVQVTASRSDRLKNALRRGQRRVRNLWKAGADGHWSPFHHHLNALVERSALRMARAEHFDLVLFESMEDTFSDFAKQRSSLPPRTKLLGISHQPPGWWKLFIPDTTVPSKLDGVFTLASSAHKYLKQSLDCAVHDVRHGVDWAYFTPPSVERPPPGEQAHLLFCGQWLRDFAMVERLVAQAEKMGIPFKLHLLVPQRTRQDLALLRIARSEHTVWHSGISDEELRQLYQSCHFLVLPLIDATANNSLLEAMACELPIFITKIGGVPDYVDESMVEFIDDDPERTIATLASCIKDYDQSRSKARLARERARSTLRWDNAAMEIYRIAVSEGAKS